MPLLQKSDLRGTYAWSAIPPDSPRITGEPDSTLFSRREGYEVLYLINRLADIWKFKQKASGLKLERLISEHLPSDVRSQSNVRAWLNKHWNDFE